MLTIFSRKRASTLALAVALATGSAVVATAVLPAEASAQRTRDRDRNKDRDRDQQESDGGGYSAEFRAAYVPLDEALKAEGADVAALRGQLMALVPLLNTDDEKIAGGGLIFNAGIKASDRALQLQGMEVMLDSGKVPAEQVGRYNFIAYQLANEAGDNVKARHYLQGAIDNNFTTEQISRPDLQIAMAENFFAAEEFDAGFDYLTNAIEGRKSQGLTVDEQWYRRGVTVAYEYELTPYVYDFATLWLSDYPSPQNWRDAVNLTRNLNTFEANEILDLFRLSRRVGALQDATDFDYYVEAADPRRLPQEVKDVIDEGMQAGIVSSGNLFITESLETANGRISADRADLPALERDAMAAGAGLRTVVAAAGTFLSYGEYDKAERLYERALGMPGVDSAEANMRLGIARIGLGNFDGAREALGQVSGNRLPIAKLWIAYANELEATTAASAAVPAVPETMPAG
ncbi:hypothetical protein [Qipengyuania nanhaisediminis]|uniref:hypothetical protein n=1 Tax=Qipengyuania nanhaisediminis TaxID=604088 RepID=UPI0038B2AB50